MNVIYDYQTFNNMSYGGVPRYFCELIHQYNTQNSNVQITLPRFWTLNPDYREITSDVTTAWKIKDQLAHFSMKILHKNLSSILMTGGKKETERLLQKQSFDLLHPTGFDSYFLKHIGKKPYILTIHDLTYERYPEYFPLNTDVRKNTDTLLQNASRVIAISEATKRDLIQYYECDSSKIDVIYHGSLFEKYNLYKPIPEDSGHHKPYLLYVGRRAAYKNFYHFVLSIAPYLRSGYFELICAGGGSFSEKEKYYLETLGVKKYVIQNTVNDTTLISLYQHAIAFVFPSIAEGFGLPMLEAFSCGCPIICSNTTSLPEIGGDAVHYFDPKDITSIQNAVLDVFQNENKRIAMIQRGYDRLSDFSWEKCAKKTEISYEKALE